MITLKLNTDSDLFELEDLTDAKRIALGGPTKRFKKTRDEASEVTVIHG